MTTSNITEEIPLVTAHQTRPTVQSIPQTSVRQTSATTVQISLPFAGQTFQGQFVQSQAFQGKFQYGQIGKNPVYQSQPYPSYTHQILSQPQFGMAKNRYPGDIPIPSAQVIPGFPGYPPLSTGIVPQGYQFSQQGPN